MAKGMAKGMATAREAEGTPVVGPPRRITTRLGIIIMVVLGRTMIAAVLAALALKIITMVTVAAAAAVQVPMPEIIMIGHMIPRAAAVPVGSITNTNDDIYRRGIESLTHTWNSIY